MRGGLLAALVRTGLLAVLLSLAAVAGWPAAAGASEPEGTGRTALVVFLGPGALRSGQAEDDAIEREFSSLPTLSTGILSATQGTYDPTQLLLDVTQGARVSYSAYSPAYPPALSLLVLGRPSGRALRESGRRATTLEQLSRSEDVGRVGRWGAIRKRAEEAPQLLDPGLLASSIPGGAAYAGVQGEGNRGGSHTAEAGTIEGGAVDWPLAANRDGDIAAVSLGPASTLLARIAALQRTHRLVVADLPSGAIGYGQLRLLAAIRTPDELLIAIQRAPYVPGHELLWSAFAGLPSSRATVGGGGEETLTSRTTGERGMIAAIDIAPTILDQLGLSVPADMRGKQVRLDGHFDGASLRALKARLVVIDPRRLPALAWLVLAWALLLAIASLPIRRTERSGRTAWAMRVGAIAMLWAPVAVLVPAALEPSRAAEFALIVAVCFTLGALTERLLPWPRAPLVPALAAVVALSADALAGTQLLMRSLLGPSPAFGARFYGIGNELKSGLAVLVFSAVAAALYPAVRGRRAAATMAGAGVLLAIVEGSARIGAGVGGVILVCAGAAVATLMLLAGPLTDRRSTAKRLLVIVAAPLLGLIVLAAIDLATAHGSGHFTGSVLDARSPEDIRDIIVRRYSAAYDELKNHLMPVATALALLASILAVRQRDRVLAPVASDPAWLAALAGGLTAGVIGALSEDSGPVLLVVAVFGLGCVLSYLWGGPISSSS